MAWTVLWVERLGCVALETPQLLVVVMERAEHELAAALEQMLRHGLSSHFQGELAYQAVLTPWNLAA
jgi:hypothetical protein